MREFRRERSSQLADFSARKLGATDLRSWADKPSSCWQFRSSKHAAHQCAACGLWSDYSGRSWIQSEASKCNRACEEFARTSSMWVRDPVWNRQKTEMRRKWKLLSRPVRDASLQPRIKNIQFNVDLPIENYLFDLSYPIYRARVTTCWCVDVKSGEARPNSKRTVSIDTIDGKDCLIWIKLELHLRCFTWLWRAQSRSRPGLPCKRLLSTQEHLYKYKLLCRFKKCVHGISRKSIPVQAKRWPERSPRSYHQFWTRTNQQNSIHEPGKCLKRSTTDLFQFDSPVIYNPSSAKSEYVQPPATPSKTYNPFAAKSEPVQQPATLSNTYREKTEPMYQPNPRVSHPNAFYGLFGNLFGRWGK